MHAEVLHPVQSTDPFKCMYSVAMTQGIISEEPESGTTTVIVHRRFITPVRFTNCKSMSNGLQSTVTDSTGTL